MIALTTLLPLVSKLGTYLSVGVEHYSALRQQGQTLSPDLLAAVLLIKMNEWRPVVKGQEIVDDDTRAAGARFLAGIAIRLAQL